MNFTPEYIKLCKNEKIQGLKGKGASQCGLDYIYRFEYGDWLITDEEDEPIPIISMYLNKDGSYDLKCERYKNITWLPTGDQLDDEIEKICKKEHGIYDFKYCPNLDIYKAEISLTKSCNFVEAVKHNPLIAKIQLLIKLLESNEKP